MTLMSRRSTPGDAGGQLSKPGLREQAGDEDGRPCILVVGDVMIDRYIAGETSRISPEAPVPIVRAEFEDCRPGGAANVAANLSALGAATRLLTVCGDDASGNDLANLMADHRVELIAIPDLGQRTTQKIRLISDGQQIARIDYDGAVSEAARAELAQCFEESLEGVSAVVFSDYDKGTLADLPEFLGLCRRRGIRAFVDPKTADAARYKDAFLLKPNKREFHALFGACSDESIVEQAQIALSSLNLEYLVVTRGAKGIVVVSRGGELVQQPTEALEVFDVTGAGDTIMAALVMGFVEGLPIDIAVDRANVAASIAISRPGTHVVSHRDLEERMRQRNKPKTKVVSLQQLISRTAAQRGSGSRLVFTNGCFDILHAGHVRLLSYAKQHGDILVVGLNSDQSVRRLKGEQRPIHCLADRADLLSEMASVDYVVAFEEDTPLKLIENLLPDVLVKGGDYTVETIVGADLVRQNGGTVVIAPTLAGRSTTAIIEMLSNEV